MEDLHAGVAGRCGHRALARTSEVVVLKWLKATIKSVIGLHPGILGRISTAVSRNDADSRRHTFAVFIMDREVKIAHLFKVMSLRRINASPRATDCLLDPKRGIAILVADIANPIAIRRETCLNAIELSKR